MNANTVRNLPNEPVSNDMQQLVQKVTELEELLKQRDQEIAELRSQLDMTVSNVPDKGKELDKEKQCAIKHRGQGISAEPHTTTSLQDLNERACAISEKSEVSRELLKNAILDNEYMKNLDKTQLKEIIDYMYAVKYSTGSIIIKEGYIGRTLYVVEEGRVEVSRQNKHLCTVTPGTVFGELAILHDCERTATATAVTDCMLWAIDRNCFQKIIMRTGLTREAEHNNLLRSLEIFKDVPDHILIKIADALEETSYKYGDYIVRQGARGDTFYVISKGRVKVTLKEPESNDEKFITILTDGAFFGEKALEGEDIRTANFICDAAEGTICLVIDRETFTNLISTVEEIRDKYNIEEDNRARINEEFANVTLSDLNMYTVLGVGAFARVALVQIKGDDSRSFALKRMRKVDIVDRGQQHHVMSEKEILSEVNCEFIVKLYRTFKDAKFLYMLMECCLGGEMWTLLRDRGKFDDDTSRFYIACVVEAFHYLHSRDIVYRDLKSENLLLDSKGYVKLVDFGFAKKLQDGHKTWTFCGTLEYIAPEVILNRGQDMSRDYWSLGVIMFEFLTGVPPFNGDDPAKVYRKILKGIDGVAFPHYICKNATNLIKKLCRENPNERIGYLRGGYADIQKHRWFDGFNWEGLIDRTLDPPYIPEIKSVLDSQNFDLYPSDLSAPPPDDFTGWDSNF